MSLADRHNIDRSMVTVVPPQSSFNVIYSNITDPYVEAVNNLGILTNSDPVSLILYHHTHSVLDYYLTG